MSKDIYRIFPPATKSQKQDLRASIEAVSLKKPIVIDEFRHIIDGHDRRDG